MLHGKRLVCRLQNFQFFDCHTVSTTLLSAFCCHLLSATPQPFFFPQSTAFFSPHSAAIFSPHSTAILHSALRSHFLSALRSHPFLHTPQSSFSQYSTAILFSALRSKMVENLQQLIQKATGAKDPFKFNGTTNILHVA